MKFQLTFSKTKKEMRLQLKQTNEQRKRYKKTRTTATSKRYITEVMDKLQYTQDKFTKHR